MTNFADSTRRIHDILLASAVKKGEITSIVPSELSARAIAHAINLESAIARQESIIERQKSESMRPTQGDRSTHSRFIERFDISSTPFNGQDCWVAIYDALSEEDDAPPWVIWRGKWVESSDTWDFLERGPISPTMLKSVCWAPSRCMSESEFAQEMRGIEP